MIVPIIRRGSEYVFPPISSIVPSGIVNSARIDVIFSVFIVFICLIDLHYKYMEYSTDKKMIFYFFMIFFTSSWENPMDNAVITVIAMIAMIAIAIMTGIHRGDVIHHHDQLISPVSFSVRKIRKITIVVLIPDEVFDDAMSYLLVM